MAGSSSALATGGACSAQSPIYRSPTFKFIVEGKDFHVHESLITQHSKPLERMIHGSMAEAQKGFATIEEVDQGTFSRFVEWLYWGYYHAAEPKQLDVAAAANEPEEPTHDMDTIERVDAWGNAVYYSDDVPDRTLYSSEKKLVKGKKQKKSFYAQTDSDPESSSASFHRSAAKNKFIQRMYTMRNISQDHPQPRPNRASGEDYTEVFLCHARLYVFADKYDVQGLKVLAMEELHAVLAVYTLHQQRTGDITSLLRYIYDETAETKKGVDNLRTLMVQYIEIEVGTLIKDEGLAKLMIQDEGCMLTDFLKVMRKRLV